MRLSPVFVLPHMPRLVAGMGVWGKGLAKGRKRVLAIVAGILVVRYLPEPPRISAESQDRIVDCKRGPMGGADHAQDRWYGSVMI
jgi:hypothetical protein